jgi:hypothetical protein
MNPYFAKLRARNHETLHPQAPSKPSKPILSVVAHADTTAERGIEGFEGDRSRCFSVEQTLFGRFSRTLEHLESRCPDHLHADRWKSAVGDGRRFLTQWGTQADALGWTVRDLFGLAPLRDEPRPSYRRLSRYDETGLIWLLRGRRVLALSESAAAVESPTGAVTVYRRHNKPALGPLGDSLDDLEPPCGGGAA